MNGWKKIALVGALIWATAAAGNVHGDQGHEGNNPQAVNPLKEARTKDPVAGRLEVLTKRLALTTGQQEEIGPIIRDEEGRIREIRSNADLSLEEKRAKMEEFRSAMFDRIRPLLDADQKGKLDALIQKSRELKARKRNMDEVKPKTD